MKKVTLFVLFVLVASLALMAAAPLAEVLTRFEIINKTSDDVLIKLESDDFYYYLTAPADDTTVFTVEREVYDATIWSCGESETASLDILTQLRLTFPDCTSLPFDQVNDHVIQGETSMEKVLLADEYPDMLPFRFQY